MRSRTTSIATVLIVSVAVICLLCLTAIRFGENDLRFSLDVYYPASVQQRVETVALHEGLWGPALDQLAVAPDMRRLVVVGKEGSFYSDDGGKTFRPLHGQVHGPVSEILNGICPTKAGWWRGRRSRDARVNEYPKVQKDKRTQSRAE